MKNKIYKRILLDSLLELSDIEYQRRVWLNCNNFSGDMSSFVEAANNFLGDSLVKTTLNQNEILFDKKTTKALQELSGVINAVDEYRPEEEIINDPLMQIVREKAAKALELVKASDYSESTVDIVE